MLVILLGALLVIGGLIYMASEALRRGRLSGTAGSSAQSPADVRDGTLEPARHGVGFLGIAGNWPGLALMALGALLLLFGAAFL
jgi:hypothetical protein